MASLLYAYTCVYFFSLSLSFVVVVFKYFGLSIRIVNDGSVIRRWRLWSNFEVQERTRIFCKSSFSVYFYKNLLRQQLKRIIALSNV
jgi:hypothetical protein